MSLPSGNEGGAPNPLDDILAGQSGTGSQNPELDSSPNEDDALDNLEENSEDQEDPNLDDQQDEDSEDQGNSEDDEDEDEDPKSKQKQNWKNLRTNLKTASKQRDAALEILRLAKKNPEILKNLKLDEEDVEELQEEIKDYSGDVQDIFKDIPVPKFKKASEYKSIEELFIDIRNGIFTSMLTFQERDRSQRTQTTRTYEKRLGSIKTEFKDESVYGEFLDYAEEQLKKPYIRKLGNQALDAILDSFRESRQGGTGKKVNPNKELSKNINKGGKPSSGGDQGATAPDQKYLRENSMDDIIADQLAKRRRS